MGSYGRLISNRDTTGRLYPWRSAARETSLRAMDTLNVETGLAPEVENQAERQARLAWEAERIAEAQASVRAGRVVSSEKVEAWIDNLGTAHELPLPRPGQ